MVKTIAVVGHEAPAVIGQPVDLVEARLAEVLADLRSFCVVVQDPPWSRLAPSLPAPLRVITARDMELTALEAMAATEDDAETVVGVGGGAALDTAKFLAWKTRRPLILAPAVTSVDAAFTDAIGARVAGRVRYIGKIEPSQVVLDLPLILSAPRRLNRAGVGDILSCHTGLFDWRLASAAGKGPPWREDLASLGRSLLGELETASADIAAVTPEAIRFLASAYRRIGAACAEAGHSRFEEGSEHFWAYALEAATGMAPLHGELISLAVVALSCIQDNDPAFAASIVSRTGVRAHPDDLDISEGVFKGALLGLAEYARAEGLDIGVADLAPITPAAAAAAWRTACALPRQSD